MRQATNINVYISIRYGGAWLERPAQQQERDGQRMPATKTKKVEEAAERAPRLTAEEILRKRGHVIKLAKANSEEYPGIVEDVEWALSYCPKGTYSVGTRTPAEHATESGYRRHKDDARRRKEENVEQDTEHASYWGGTPCDPCEIAHKAHLVESKKSREIADKQRNAVNGICRKWFRANRSTAVDMIMEAEELIEAADGGLAAGSYRGFPTLGDDEGTLDDTEIPVNVMMAWLAERQEVAKLSRGVWKQIEFSIDAFEEVES